MNLYTYVHNNPLGYIDPSGHAIENAEYNKNQHDYLESVARGEWDKDAIGWAQNELANERFYIDPDEPDTIYSGFDVDGGVSNDYATPALAVGAIASCIVSCPALGAAAMGGADVAGMGATTASLTGSIAIVGAKIGGLGARAWNSVKGLFGTKAIPEYVNMLEAGVTADDLIIGAYQDGKISKAFLQGKDLGGAGHKAFLEGTEVGFYVYKDVHSGEIMVRGSGTASVVGGRYANEAELNHIAQIFGKK